MKILKIFYYLFFTAVAIIVLLLVASAVPIPGNYKVMIVQSGSMEPTIKTGAVVVVKPRAEYKVGDIVTFESEGSSKKTVTHRIVEEKNKNGTIAFVTKGDANNGNDQREIAKEEIIGKMLFDVPYVGYVVAGARNPYGFMAMIVFPALIIIFDEVKKIRSEIKKGRKKVEPEKSEPVKSELDTKNLERIVLERSQRANREPEKFVRHRRIV